MGPEGEILYKIEGICDGRNNSYFSSMVLPKKAPSPPWLILLDAEEVARYLLNRKVITKESKEYIN